MEFIRDQLDFVKQSPSNSSLKPRVKNLLKAEDYCLRAEQLLKNKQWSQAQNILQTGLVKIGDSAKAYHLLALALYYQGSFQASLKYFRRACGKERNTEYFLNLSIALNDLGNYKEAAKAYEQAEIIKTQTQEQSWRLEVCQKHNETAESYLKKGELKRALQEYIKGVSFYPLPEAELQVAHLLWKLNQTQKAQQYLKTFIYTHPNHIKAHLMLAGWYFEKKQIPEATNEWERVLKLEPQNKEAGKNLRKVQELTEFFS